MIYKFGQKDHLYITKVFTYLISVLVSVFAKSISISVPLLDLRLYTENSGASSLIAL